MVNMKRVMEAKKADKMKKNLHLIDFPKGNTKVQFVSNYAEIKQRVNGVASKTVDSDDEESDYGEGMQVPTKVGRLDTEQIRREVIVQQS